MLTLSFCGKCSTLFLFGQKYDRVYVDRSYHDVVPQGVDVVFVDTGVPYSEGNEMVNRRVRIAKMLKEIIGQEDDDLLVVDSDVYLPVRGLRYDHVTAFCIYAKLKPTLFIGIFCYPTTFYLPRHERGPALSVLGEYLGHHLYYAHPVDIYFHTKMRSNTAIIRGTAHVIDGRVYVV